MKHDNKPLTLEELRQMEGQPVWVASINPLISQWAIVEYGDIDNVISFQDSKNELNLLVSWYGKAWLAYAQKSIDFDKWEPCEFCKTKNAITVNMDMTQYEFCPFCGLPITDEARQMLENRLAGRNNEQ